MTVEPDWRDRLLGVLTNPSILYLLLLAGVAGMPFELTHPGIFAPGVLGGDLPAARRLRAEPAAGRLRRCWRWRCSASG